MDRYYSIRKLIAEHADENKARQMAQYMRHRFRFHGLPAAGRKRCYQDFLRQERQNGCIDWPLLDECWQDEYRELQYFVSDYLLALKSFLTFTDIPKIEEYVRGKQWWDTIDSLCKIIGYIGLNDSRTNLLMLQWSLDPDIWVRRAAIEHQLGRKGQTNTNLLASIIVNNFGSNEFFINKAIGWALRDFSRTNPAWVRNFLQIHQTSMHKISCREAGKYL